MPTYDYLIIGAGTAGSVLARRLSDDPGVRVLLLEESGKGERKPTQPWRTAPQEALFHRTLDWSEGQALDEDASPQAAVALRGHPADYDDWAAQGGAGWSYEEVLPYFSMLDGGRHSRPGASEEISESNGAGEGPRTGRSGDPDPAAQAFVRAAIEAGLPYCSNFNRGRPEGVGFPPVFRTNGRSREAASAFLQAAAHRRNLTVLTGAHAARVALRDQRVTGVAYVFEGQERWAGAEEVIICAGAIATPLLLMRSGIGSARSMERVGIDVEHDLPGVGQGLQDPLAVRLVCRYKRSSPQTTGEQLWEMVRYVFSGTKATAMEKGEACAFARTRDGLRAPDIQFCFDAAFEGHEGKQISLRAVLVHPQSRGYVTLRAPDSEETPVIQPHYLSAADDLEALVEGVRLGRRILGARPLRAQLGEEVSPGPTFSGGDDLRAFVRLEAERVGRPVGTCRMGSGAEAVVDPDLRVRGVEGLRVVGPAAMPAPVRALSDLPSVMMAEKAAGLILPRHAAPGGSRERPFLHCAGRRISNP